MDQCTARNTAVADAVAEQAGGDDHEHQVERERAEALPHGAVLAEERNDRVEQGELRIRVEQQADDVHDEKERRSQRHVAVHQGDGEARQTGQRPARAGHDTEQHRDGEQHERGDSRASAESPECVFHLSPPDGTGQARARARRRASR